MNVNELRLRQDAGNRDFWFHPLNMGSSHTGCMSRRTYNCQLRHTLSL